MPAVANGLGSRCDLLRSLHRPGAPLILPNAWDATTARAVAAAGFPAAPPRGLEPKLVFLVRARLPGAR